MNSPRHGLSFWIKLQAWICMLLDCNQCSFSALLHYGFRSYTFHSLNIIIFYSKVKGIIENITAFKIPINDSTCYRSRACDTEAHNTAATHSFRAIPTSSPRYPCIFLLIFTGCGPPDTSSCGIPVAILSQTYAHSHAFSETAKPRGTRNGMIILP